MLSTVLLLLGSISITSQQFIGIPRVSRQLDLGLQDINYSSQKPPETIEISDARSSNFQAPGYLPPIEASGAQNQPAIAVPLKNTNPTHHGRDLCTDPFHSFLCDTAKPRKRITGARPGGIPEGASSNNFLVANPFPVPSKDLAPPFNDIEEVAYTTTTTEVPTTTTFVPTYFTNTFPTTIFTTTTTTTTTPAPTTQKPTTTTRRTTTTVKATTTTTRRPTTTTTRRPTTTTTTEKFVVNSPEATNNLRSYLPPDRIAPAAAQPEIAVVKPEEDHHHHHRDICSDPFHAFLCEPLKARKRITGALPNRLIGQSSFIQSQKVLPKPEPRPAPSNEIERAYLPPSTTKKPTSIRVIPEPSNEIERTYIPPSTTRRPPPTTTRRPTSPRIIPEPSNEIERAYLPPSTTRRPTTTTRRPTSPIVIPQPSNEIERAYLPPSTTRRPTSTTTRRVSTVRISPEPSNEIDRFYLPPSTTKRPIPTSTRRYSINQIVPEPSNEVVRPYVAPSTTRRPITTTSTTPATTTTTTTRRPSTVKFIPQASNEINREYLPPSTTHRPLTPQASIIRLRPEPSNELVRQFTVSTTPSTTTARLVPLPSNSDRAYLPPEPQFDTAAAQPDPVIIKPKSQNPTHHGRDLCTDPFHSFLCVAPKKRARITGAFPPGYKPESTNIKPEVVKPLPNLEPANTFVDESRVKPGYDYPKPSTPFNYPTAQRTLQLSTNDFRIVVIPKDTFSPAANQPVTEKAKYEAPKPKISTPAPVRIAAASQTTEIKGYQYPKPQVAFPLPTEQKEVKLPQATEQLGYSYPKPATQLPTTTQGYSYPKPEKRLPLPSERKEVVGYDYLKPAKELIIPSATQNGYSYPKPDNRLPLPTEQKEVVGYQYPKPDQSLILPSKQNGYSYPRPNRGFPLPSEINLGLSSSSLPAFTETKSLGSADFIPVNKVDLRSAESSNIVPRTQKFGERLKRRERRPELLLYRVN